MNSPRTALHLLLGQLQKSFENLKVEISPHALEGLASTVYQVLTARERRYHTTRHVSDSSILKDPSWTLAASFYDLVYLQTDKRVHPLIRPALEGFVVDEDLSVTVPAADSENMPYYLKLTLRVFEVSPGKKLKLSAEENKFLSAVVAAYFLCDLIEAWDLFRVLVCIQATVPILGLAHLEDHAGDRLLQRLELMNVEFQFKKTHEELKQLVSLAMSVANHDRMAFAASPEVFLTQVLSLMLETHPVLRNPGCSIRQMRMSFQRYHQYLRSLDSNQIFQRFKGLPLDLEYIRLKKKADQNLSFALSFFRAILVALYLLEAVSMLTGGDAPYLLFTGHPSFWEAKSSMHGGSQIFLSSLMQRVKERGGCPTVSDLFPFVAYLTAEMTDSEIYPVMALEEQYVKGDLSGLDFLSSAYSPDLLQACLQALAQVTMTRQKRILEVREFLATQARKIHQKSIA